MAVGLVGCLSVLEYSLRTFIIGIYSSDPEVVRTGALIISITVPFNILFMPVEVFAGTMRGTGYSVMPTVITCTCVCLFRVLWIATVVRHFHRLEMLAACYPISWLLSSIVFYIAYLRGTWLKSRIEKSGMAPEIRPGR